MKYKKIIDGYIQAPDFDFDRDEGNFLNKIFFVYPPLKISSDEISEILQEISDYFGIPFHDIKIIGSSHLGFSFVKPKDSNEVKLFDKESDIDIAIINRNLFYNTYCNSFEATNGFIDNTKFDNARCRSMFKNNILKGYIRPDTIANTQFRKDWLRFFKEISIKYEKKISAAIYLNEVTFHKKIESALKIYKGKVLVTNGVK